MTPARKESAWTPEELDLLGSATDTEIAKLTGRKVAAVASKRKSLGIARVSWAKPIPAKALEILGTMPDKQAAELLGVPYAKARQWRADLGRPPYRKHPDVERKREMILRLKSEGLPTPEIASAIGVTASRIRQILKEA